MNNSPEAVQKTSLKQTLKRWTSKYLMFLTLPLLILLWQGFWWHFNTPIKNPWPEKPYTIKGRFPFDKGFDIVFGLNVVGNAKWHQWICGGIAVTYAGCDGGTLYFHPQKTDGKNYQITMYKDYYLQGLPQWGESRVFYKQFKANIAFNFEASVTGGQVTSTQVPIICDDSEGGLRKSNGALRCRPLYNDKERKVGHLKYKHLNLPTMAPAGPNEQVMDFWLYSELDEMLKTQPAPTPSKTQP